jgi:hypothetical protein
VCNLSYPYYISRGWVCQVTIEGIEPSTSRTSSERSPAELYGRDLPQGVVGWDFTYGDGTSCPSKPTNRIELLSPDYETGVVAFDTTLAMLHLG